MKDEINTDIDAEDRRTEGSNGRRRFTQGAHPRTLDQVDPMGRVDASQCCGNALKPVGNLTPIAQSATASPYRTRIRIRKSRSSPIRFRR
jgi:hypothetical protein